MHNTVQNLINIKNEINSEIKNLNYTNYKPNIIAISKTFKISHIQPLIDYGHEDFGENKVQEAIQKWTDVKKKNPKINLHMVGKLQTNKVKYAIKLFDYIHSVDNDKLANKISEEQIKNNLRPKIFIQVNIGDEIQKGGINKNNTEEFYNYCKKLNLNIIGLMCIPPDDNNSDRYFSEIQYLNEKINSNKLSMGMSNDYIIAVKNKSSFLRIGSKIFGKRF